MTALGKECLCQKFDSLLIAVKPESLYSDDSAPAASDVIVAEKGATITTLAEKSERNLAKATWGNDPSSFVNKFVQIQFTTEVTGSGAPGDLPNMAYLLRAAGMQETQTPGVDVVYTPASENIASNSVYFYHGDELWKVVGCRTTSLSKSYSTGIPKWNVTLTGLFTKPIENTTMPTPVISGVSRPLVVNFANTKTAKLFGIDVDIEQFDLNWGLESSNNDRPGCNDVRIEDRKPTSALTICDPGISTLDVRDKADKGETGAFQLIHGVDPGTVVETNIPAYEFDQSGVQATAIDKKKGLQAPGSLLPVSGDDELSITFR